MSSYVQYGCGLCAPSEWQNFDASLSLRLGRVGRLVNRVKFPPNVRYGNIVKGLPIPPRSVAGLYASHVLEHLSRHDFEVALSSSFALLIPSGVFRLIVPDLLVRAEKYIAAARLGAKDANDGFMRSSHLGSESAPTLLRAAFGHSAHLWMWDEPSMAAALTSAGFVNIRRCRYGDADDRMFDLVEDKSRFHDADINASELAMEARRPA